MALNAGKSKGTIKGFRFVILNDEVTNLEVEKQQKQLINGVNEEVIVSKSGESEDKAPNSNGLIDEKHVGEAYGGYRRKTKKLTKKIMKVVTCGIKRRKKAGPFGKEK